MKATLFLSSIFFLLGLKVSSLLDLNGKANAVDQIISTKIMNVKPLNAVPFFKEVENKETAKDVNLEKDDKKKENDIPEDIK